MHQSPRTSDVKRHPQGAALRLQRQKGLSDIVSQLEATAQRLAYEVVCRCIREEKGAAALSMHF